MNRKLKSALSVLLVITMALSLGISAFAEETEGQEQLRRRDAHLGLSEVCKG